MMRPDGKTKVLILFISFIAAGLSLKAARAEEAMAPEARPAADKTEYKSDNLRDPFQEEHIEVKEEPQEEKEAKPLPAIKIQGIVWGGAVPQAIINNKVMKVGDTVEGARITDINKSGVTLFFDNHKYNLTTSSSTIQKDSKSSPRPTQKVIKGGKHEEQL